MSNRTATVLLAVSIFFLVVGLAMMLAVVLLAVQPGC